MPRDAQFLGFAKLLWEDLERAIREHGFIPESDTKRAAFLLVIESIIAQRAYDLVYHTLGLVPQLIVNVPNATDISGVIGYVPDMTAVDFYPIVERPKENKEIQ